MPTIRQMATGFIPFAPTGFAMRYRGPVFDTVDPPAPPPTPPAPKPLAPPAPVPDPAPEPDAKAWARLQRESAEHRHAAKTATERLVAAEAERDRLTSENTAAATAKTAAETEAATLRASVKKTTTSASLKVAAIQAGIVDLEALKLIDPASLELDDAGELKDGAAVMAKLKTEKPYLFPDGQKTPVKPTTTGNPPPPPPPKPADKKPALAMTDEEFAAATKQSAWRK